MLNELDFMVRFWQLEARDRSAGARLTAAERAELTSLLRVMATDHHLPPAGPPPRAGRGAPVQLAAPGGFVTGELRLVCAEGLVVASGAQLHARQRTALHLADAVSGLEYTVPCVIEWAWPGPAPALGLRVNGCPTRASFGRMPEPSMWRIALGWLEPPRPLSE